MPNIERCGEIERACQLGRHLSRIVQHARLSNDDVERIGGDKVLGEVGRTADKTGRKRSGNSGMREIGVDEALEAGDEFFHPVEREIEPKSFTATSRSCSGS